MSNLKRKTIFVALFLAFGNAFGSETVWCRNFNFGCPTQEEQNRKFQNCKMLSNQSYEEALVKAISDPSIWRLNGHTSAKEYAEWRRNFMLSLCMRNT